MGERTQKLKIHSEKEISNGMYVAKFIAIFSVCCAHTYYGAFQTMPHLLNFLYQFGTFGVAVFFFISGYYFKKEKLKIFVYKKMRYMMVPWLFWGSAAYFIRFIDNYDFYFDPAELLRWLFGSGTYLWFLTVLLIMQICFLILSERQSVLLILMGLSILSRLATSAGWWAQLFDHYNYYLNVLNWIGFFAFGKYVSKKKNWLSWLFENKKIVLMTGLSISAVCAFIDPLPTYAGWTNPVIQLMMIPVTLIAADAFRKVKIFIVFGQYTMCLYLIHMPIIGKINTIFQSSAVYALIKPIAVMLLLSCLIFVGSKLSEKLKLQSVYCLLTGLKSSRRKVSIRNGAPL